MRRRIKTKIIFSAAAIITISLLAVGAVSIEYFRDIIKTQVMSDEAIKIKQTSAQIQYFQNDIRQFAQYILVDSDIQMRLNVLYSDNVYERLSSEEWLSTKLKSYLLLKDYIDSVVLVGNDGKVISSNPIYNSYYSDSLQEDWHQELLNRNVFDGFSDKHVWQSNLREMDAVSYMIKYNPALNPDSRLHHLIVHINLDNLLKAVSMNTSEYDAIYLLNAGNSVLHAEEKRNVDVSLDSLLARSGSMPAYSEETRGQIANVNQAMLDQWKLVTFKSKQIVFQKIDDISYFFVISTIVSILFILLTLTPVIVNITRPILSLTQAMKQVAMGKLDSKVSIRSGDEIELLGNGFNRMLQELQNYIEQSIQDEKIKQKLQIELLLSQINPHFIYNTLNTVIYLAQRQGNYDIVKMMESFIRLLQDTISTAKDDYFATVEEEIANVRDYLLIQKYRYPDRFVTDWQVDEDTLRERIPRTLLQPLVENAIFHGLIPVCEQGTITISFNRSERQLFIRVSDNGIGMDAALIEKFENGDAIGELESGMRPIGLANVRDRIRAYYGLSSEIRIESGAGRGTTIAIVIPLHDSEFYTE
ncbi:sensor histidine kinase [Paenibacillus arenilitoris]|uniref:histidine kinase n=1 Tax=Paenibacillus arenilitoris TaxID=2772299 RepID=A0A927CNB0_9BACL|nr:histidine kinase [Paenibacillus arenilitoris]MBD2868976.1 sensor histidine kinase [Paenibacillus arenilitoris]